MTGHMPLTPPHLDLNERGCEGSLAGTDFQKSYRAVLLAKTQIQKLEFNSNMIGHMPLIPPPSFGSQPRGV